jgi:hypothetical protein
LKKFCQTFVLAQQPTGYFVLNDIFRYINEEGEEEQVDAAAPQEESAGPLVEDVEMPKAQTSTEESAALDTEVVAKKLVETLESEPAAAEVTTNGTAEDTVEKDEEEAPAAAETKEEIPTPEAAVKAVEEENIKEPEKPQDPTPSPSATHLPTVAKPAAPVQPAGPPKPLTWASRAAAAAGPPKPVVPVVAKTSTPPAQPRAAPASKPAPAQPAATPAAEKNKENAQPDGWQTAGDHAKRQNRPQSVSGPPEREGTMGYVRNVFEKVLTDDLKATLSSFGQLVYFDVNRSKV